MCDVKVVTGRIRHCVGGDGVRVVVCRDGGRWREEGRKGSADGGGEGEGGGDGGNIEVVLGFWNPLWAWGEYHMDQEGGTRVGEGVHQRKEGGYGEDGGGPCDDNTLLQNLHGCHSKNAKCTTNNFVRSITHSHIYIQ